MRINIDYLSNLSSPVLLYHYTSFENLHNICNENQYQLVSGFKLSNVINYFNVFCQVGKQPIIWFFLGEPTETQLYCNSIKEPTPCLVINLEKCKDSFAGKRIYYRFYDKALLVCSKELAIGKNAVCLGETKKGTGNILTGLKQLFSFKKTPRY